MFSLTSLAFFWNNNNFLHEFKWRWFNLCYGTQRQTRICLQTMQNIFAHQLGVFSVTIIISYTSSSGFGSISATARSVRRVFCLQTVQNIFTHLLCVFWAQVIISYTNSSGNGHFFATARSVRHGFFANRAKYFRSPVGCFLNTGNNFLYEFKWQWTNFCYGAQRPTRFLFAQFCFAHQLGAFVATVIFSHTSWSVLQVTWIEPLVLARDSIA